MCKSFPDISPLAGKIGAEGDLLWLLAEVRAYLERKAGPWRPEAGGMTALRADRGFRERVRRVHRLGPRPVGELLAEFQSAHPQTRGFMHQRLDAYARLDQGTIARLGGDDRLEPAAVIRLVAGGRA